jgi:hypothetical protein
MREADVQSFWSAHPCGDHMVGGLHDEYADDYERFFTAYDTWRYEKDGHIPIYLGQGTESEQIVRRGASWSGLDLTRESVDRVAPAGPHSPRSIESSSRAVSYWRCFTRAGR